MKKISIIIMAVICLLEIGKAQTQIGLKVAYSTGLDRSSMLSLDNGNDQYVYNFRYTGQSNVMSVGIATRKKLGTFFFAQEMSYRKTSYNFEIRDLSIIDPSKIISTSQADHNFMIPLAMGFNLGNVSFAAGPIFNYKIKCQRSADLDRIFRVQDEKLTTAFQFILGFNVNKHITLDIKYEHALGGVTDGYYFNNEKVKFKTRPDIITLGLSYFL